MYFWFDMDSSSFYIIEKQNKIEFGRVHVKHLLSFIATFLPSMFQFSVWSWHLWLHMTSSMDKLNRIFRTIESHFVSRKTKSKYFVPGLPTIYFLFKIEVHSRWRVKNIFLVSHPKWWLLPNIHKTCFSFASLELAICSEILVRLSWNEAS